MSILTENKDIVRRWYSGMNEHDADAVAHLVADDVVNHSAIPEAQGAAGLRRILAKVWSSMPDMRYACEDLIAEGDRVVARITVRGTQTGPLDFARLGLPPTNKSVTTEQIHVFRVENGKIVEHWAGRDDIGMLRQLGVLDRLREGGAK